MILRKAMILASALSLIVVGCECCSKSGGNPGQKGETLTLAPLIDEEATSLTVSLHGNMWKLLDRGTMFGAQIPTLYGLDGGKAKWYDTDGKAEHSDTKYLIGTHPAVCGWEISGIETGQELNIDKENFNDIRTHIQAAYRRGAVNTMSWHCANPVTDGNSWDPTRAVYAIIPGGYLNDKFNSYLDHVADFISSLKTDDGELIPIIFRPWHEHTGAGFWWGKGNATKDEFVALWRYTVEYLRDKKGLHNLIWAYSPDMCHLSSRNDYLEYWPGDEYVDILGLDAYDREGQNYGHRGLQLVRMANVIAAEKHKMFALTETGLENNAETSAWNNKKWWTTMLHHIIAGQRVSFALVWRNGDFPSNGGHYFNAFRGCWSEDDFVKFAGYDDVLFERDLPKMYE